MWYAVQERVSLLIHIWAFWSNAVHIEGVVVGVLSGHNSGLWSNSSCTNGGKTQIMCNLRVYEAAVAVAAQNGVDLFVLPEAYGLSGVPYPTGFYEPQIASVDNIPCDDVDESSPQQKAHSCMAKAHRIAIATNIFTKLDNGSHRITEVVYDQYGAVVAVHDKIHLAPVFETGIFEAGSIKSTTFDLFGRRWGILVCYEGIYPYTLGFGDFSQMQGLVDEGATAFVWSIGGSVPPVHASRLLATKFQLPVVASEVMSRMSQASAIVDAQGEELTQAGIPVDLAYLGYVGNVTVSFGVLPATLVV
mmetsp:Transcript_101775/g.273678  ORF Transcript_101775/g.273678 Transcript_101775/m.273678 type:complete len:304 (-) Transcript_101775:326-1237(-)